MSTGNGPYVTFTCDNWLQLIREHPPAIEGNLQRRTQMEPPKPFGPPCHSLKTFDSVMDGEEKTPVVAAGMTPWTREFGSFGEVN
ncbi:hypothetical protein ZHAS_00012526 [Anopheles sinensis]|uniref:Uncharacterized protein n=1 Tax=Anopheles sinensis TaxID=74873 RepID=A0A084W346_ANOSI|nr:hypothetical protein ZHAS_00012526 [Anopheles sinensis]